MLLSVDLKRGTWHPEHSRASQVLPSGVDGWGMVDYKGLWCHLIFRPPVVKPLLSALIKFECPENNMGPQWLEVGSLCVALGKLPNLSELPHPYL